MDGTELDSWIPGLGKSALVVGGVIAGMVGWVYSEVKKSASGTAPEMNLSRNDFIEIFKAETRENRDVLANNRETLLAILSAMNRLIALTEDIARRSAEEAGNARAVEIAERIVRQAWDSRHDRLRDGN